MTVPQQIKSTFAVSFFQSFWGKFVHSTPTLQQALGTIESTCLRRSLKHQKITRPVFISSLPRSGTTILLEILASHPKTASHAYQDFPFIFTPYVWHQFLRVAGRKHVKAQERSHRDGMMVTPQSPEAFEEMIWSSFFPSAHNTAVSHILDAATHHPEFERFFTDHIKKLLLANRRETYVSKANYHVARIEYLIQLFPDAKIIIPIRDPIFHIASLIKQQKLFSEAAINNHKLNDYLTHVGHFEFGDLRRPINLNHHPLLQPVIQAWECGDEIVGWSLYWNMIYSYLATLLTSNPAMQKNILFISYETLCAHPSDTIRQILDFCDLDKSIFPYDQFVTRIQKPSYYQHGFSSTQIELIQHLTHEGQQFTLHCKL